MKRFKYGFTLIEVSLFLALTALLFAGIAAGVQNSIYQQRFNDSVQNFAEFLRTAYSQVLNVQNDGNGRSKQAIYGKLVTFNKDDSDKNVINTYNVVGNIDDEIGTGEAIELLRELNGNIVVTNEEGELVPVGFVESYTPKWGAVIQKSSDSDDSTKSFEGALLVIRHPLSGTVYTYVSEDKVNQSNFSSLLNSVDSGESPFKIEEVVFCVNPNGPNEGGARRGVRVAKNARNASSITIVPDSEGKCGGA